MLRTLPPLAKEKKDQPAIMNSTQPPHLTSKAHSF